MPYWVQVRAQPPTTRPGRLYVSCRREPSTNNCGPPSYNGRGDLVPGYKNFYTELSAETLTVVGGATNFIHAAPWNGGAGGADVSAWAIDFALSYVRRVRSLVIANAVDGVQDADYVELERRIRPAQFDALPPAFRELEPSHRAANT